MILPGENGTQVEKVYTVTASMHKNIPILILMM